MVFPLNFRDMFGGNTNNQNPPQSNNNEELPVNDKEANHNLSEINETQQKHLSNFQEFNEREKKSDKIRTPKEKLEFKNTKLWDKLKINKLFPAMFGLLGKISSGIWSRMGGFFGDIMELMFFALVDPKGSMLASFLKALIPMFMNLIVLVTNVFISVIPTILKVFVNALPKIIELLTNAFVAVLQMVPLIIKIIIDAIPVIWKAIVKAVPLILDAFVQSFNIIKKELFKIPAIANMFTKIESKAKDIKKYFFDMYDKIKNTFKEFSEKLKQIKTNILNFVNENILPFFSAIKESFMKNFEPIKDSFIRIYNSISGIVSKYLDSSLEKIQIVYKGMGEVFQNFMPIIDQIIITFKDLFVKLANAFERIMPLISDFMDVFNKLYVSVIPKVFQVINFIMKSLPGIISFIGDTIGIIIDIIAYLFEIITPVVIFLIDIGIQIFDVLWTVGEILWDLSVIIINVFMGVFDQIFSIIKLLWGAYVKYLHPIVKFIFGALWSGFKLVFQLFVSLGKIIFDAIKNIVEKIKSLFDGIKIPKIGDLFQKAIDKAMSSDTLKKIKDVFKNILDIIENSTVWKTIMKGKETVGGWWDKFKKSVFGDESQKAFKEKLKLKLNEDQLKYLTSYVVKDKEEARKDAASLGLSQEMIEAIESIGESMIEANGGKADTQKMFNENKIVDAIEKLGKKGFAEKPNPKLNVVKFN